MSFPRSAVFILLPTGALVGGVWGCGISSAAAVSGAGGTSGSVAVAASASSSSSSAASGTGGSGGSGIGGPCLDDTQCAPGLSCLGSGVTDPVFGGGAPNGFCTLVCSMDADCVGFGGVCYATVMGAQGECTLSCAVGPPLDGDAGTDGDTDAGADAGAALKCLGRDDVRCAKVAVGVDDCIPTCSSDSQCPGRVCDPRSAVCVDPPGSQGAPTGTPCNASALSDGGAYNPCAGVCILFDSGNGMCSQPCVLGGDAGDECGGLTNGLCVFHPDPNGDGDTGYCTNACTTPSDCNNPTFGCFGIEGLSSTNGYCFAATPCPNGDSDCSGTPGYVCTSTPGGPQCLDPKYLPTAPDGGVPEGGVPEGGTDAGMDGGTHDTGMDDAGTDDAGDAGASDVDGGA